jgi:addiction module RelB/DinJ family antitoxin
MAYLTDTDLVRFRIEGEIKRKAVRVCEDLGLELNDVLRTVVRRIANDDALPFDMTIPNRVAEPVPLPFNRHSDFPADELAHLRAEALITLLATAIANRAHRIAEEKRKARPNKNKLLEWEAQLREAMDYRRSVNTRDANLVAELEKRYTALLTADP